jgi:ribosomal protein S19
MPPNNQDCDRKAEDKTQHTCEPGQYEGKQKPSALPIWESKVVMKGQTSANLETLSIVNASTLCRNWNLTPEVVPSRLKVYITFSNVKILRIENGLVIRELNVTRKFFSQRAPTISDKAQMRIQIDTGMDLTPAIEVMSILPLMERGKAGQKSRDLLAN